MQNKLKKNKEDIDHLRTTNQTIFIQERKGNDEQQPARRVLIEESVFFKDSIYISFLTNSFKFKNNVTNQHCGKKILCKIHVTTLVSFFLFSYDTACFALCFHRLVYCSITRILLSFHNIATFSFSLSFLLECCILKILFNS